MSISRTIASIVAGALIGGGIGLIAGSVGGADNPFYIMAVGIAVGAGGSLAWDAARRGR